MEGDSIFSNDLDKYITKGSKNKIPFERSFASYEGKTDKGKLKKDCWVVEKNNGITPRDIMKCNQTNTFWFQCDVCNHGFQAILNHITSSNGTWCPYCSNHKICDDITCSFCVGKSFVRCENLAQ